MGSSVAPDSRTVRMSSGPAITSDSLLASNNRLPARAAASVEGNPAAPTMAAMTLWTSGKLRHLDRDRRHPSARASAPGGAQFGFESRGRRRVGERRVRHGEALTLLG